MTDREPPDGSADAFTAEVSDLRRRMDATSTERPAQFVAPSRLPSRQRIVRLVVVVSAVALALLVVLGGNPALRTGMRDLIPGLAPTATPAAGTPSEDLFYLLPNPPGVDVLLDSRQLARPPAPGDSHPLRLARGRHTFAWRSHALSFPPLLCHVSVPRAVTDDCPFVAPEFLPHELANLHGTVIDMHESLDTLDPQDAQQLTDAIQAALDAIRSTATVQPGEPYMASATDRQPAIARRPLRAVRNYQFVVADPGYPEPCTLGQPAIPCRFPGQHCGQFCTVAQPPASVAGPAGSWVAAATVHASWDYFTADGRAVARQVPELFGVQLAVLRITHDAGGWHAAVILGHTPGLDAADDLACDPARYALAGTTSWSFMLTDPPPGAQVQLVSGAVPADGCAAVLNQGQPAIFLQRFGVLLTVNDAARNPADNLPVADSTERDLAQRLVAQLQTSGASGKRVSANLQH
jgi:hypothetical protein